MPEKFDLEFNREKFAEYKGTDQLKLLRKLEDTALAFAMVDKSLVVKAEELHRGNLSLNVFKKDKWLIGIDCMKDKIVIRHGLGGPLGERAYSDTDEAIVEKELRDAIKENQ